jgi:hypothetical protein
MEVMLSMAVLGAAMCALVTAMSVSLKSQARVETLAVEEELAEAKLLELRTQPGGATPGETQGRFPEPYDAYRWHCLIEAPQAEGLFLRATVEIQKGEPARVHRFRTLLANADR